jgi:hypothetical protein
MVTMVSRDKRLLNPKPPRETTRRRGPRLERERSRSEAEAKPGPVPRNTVVAPATLVAENALGIVQSTTIRNTLVLSHSFRGRNEC